MNNIEEKVLKVLGAIGMIFVLVMFNACVTPSGRAMFNKHFYEVQKIDDATNYKTLKIVEDTCRTMISSYESDKLIYEQYKTSENEEKQSWAEQAKIRANRTATSYNNYILKNSYVWKDNVPDDIKMELNIID